MNTLVHSGKAICGTPSGGGPGNRKLQQHAASQHTQNRRPGGAACPSQDPVTLSRLRLLLLLLQVGLVDEGLVDVGDDTAASNGGLDQCIQLLVSADGQLQMAGRDALHLQVLGGVSCQLQHLSGEVLEDGARIHGRGGTDTLLVRHALLEETVNTTHRELQSTILLKREGGSGMAPPIRPI